MLVMIDTCFHYYIVRLPFLGMRGFSGPWISMDFTGRDPLRGCKHLTDGGSGGRGCFFFFACARISSITPLHTKTGLKIEKEGQVRMDTSPARRPPKYNCPTVRSGPVGPSLGILMNIFWARFCVFLATRWGDD